jgi:hypothetical protein
MLSSDEGIDGPAVIGPMRKRLWELKGIGAAPARPFFLYSFMLYRTEAAFLSCAAYSFHPVREPARALQHVPMCPPMAWETRRGRPTLLR